MEEKVLCFFHANCVDGAASAAVIRHKYPQAKCYPMNHGDALRAKVKNKKLFIVDFSFRPEILKRFQEEALSVHWYDHHITAVPFQKEVGWGDIDLKESGASLTWKMEFPDKPLPKIIEYVRDKDLYEWKLPDSRAVSMYLRGVTEINNPLGDFWKNALNGIPQPEWEAMIEKGNLALKFQRAQLKQGLKCAFPIDFHGHRTLALNWVLEASDMGEMIYKELGYEVALMFYYTSNLWNISLRSEKVDVSKLALKYGGGGHPGASGFRTESVDWLLKLKKKPEPEKK